MVWHRPCRHALPIALAVVLALFALQSAAAPTSDAGTTPQTTAAQRQLVRAAIVDSAARVKTIATTRARILDFAQDGGFITWIDTARALLGECNTTVRFRRLSPPRGTSVPLQAEICGAASLALGGTRAVWAVRYGGAGTQYVRLETATFGQPRVRWVEELTRDSLEVGENLVMTAADGDTSLYLVSERRADPDCSLICEPTRFGTRIVRISGKFTERRAGNSPDALVAVGGGHIATVEADQARSRDSRVPGSRVQLMNVRGEVVRSFTAGGRVATIAVSRRRVALLVYRGSRKRLEIRDANSGVLRAAVLLPAGTARELRIAGSTAVFRTGKTIRAFEASTRTSRVLATAAATPIGLSIEGRRVAWAENLTRGSRVRALVLQP